MTGCGNLCFSCSGTFQPASSPLFLLFEWLGANFPNHFSIILGGLFILIVFGGLLGNLDPKAVSNLDKAIQNAMEFAAEVVAKLKAVQAEQGRAA